MTTAPLVQAGVWRKPSLLHSRSDSITYFGLQYGRNRDFQQNGTGAMAIRKLQSSFARIFRQRCFYLFLSILFLIVAPP